MRQIKLTKSERAIEAALLRGEYVDVSKAHFKDIVEALIRRKRKRIR